MEKKTCFASQEDKRVLVKKLKTISYENGYSNLCMRDVFLIKIKNEQKLYLYYTGSALGIKSLKWMAINICDMEKPLILSVQLEYKPEVKFIYFVFPILTWFFLTFCVIQNLIFFLIMAIFQIILSTIILCFIKNVGVKMQKEKIFNLLQKELKCIKL